MSEQTYIVATPQPWHLAELARVRRSFPGHWLLVTTTADLEAALASVSPRYIFFPHWSHLVPEPIVERFECVCFHMTDLPYGRGGSPLQNLIERGHRETQLSALRMVKELDAGPIYGKRPLTLEGSAEEIFERTAALIGDMIAWIVQEEPAAVPQEGEPTIFTRRTPSQSRIPPGASPEKLYDHIRMLDAPGYPKAFLDHEQWRVEFERAELKGDVVEARARFTRNSEDES